MLPLEAISCFWTAGGLVGCFLVLIGLQILGGGNGWRMLHAPR